MTTLLRSVSGPGSSQPARHGAVRLESSQVSRLTSSDAASLYVAMGEVARAATTGPDGSSWIDSDWAQRFGQFGSSRCYTAWLDDELIGFMWTKQHRLVGWRFLHLQAAYVLPEHHGRGVGFALNARMLFTEVIRRFGRQMVLVADMASPIAFHGWRSRARSTESFFPHLSDTSGEPSDSPLAELAGIAAAHLYPGVAYDSESGVLLRKTAPTRSNTRWSNEPAVDRFFGRYVDRGAGDTCLVVMRPSPVELFGNTGQMARAIPRALRHRLQTNLCALEPSGPGAVK